MGKAEKLFERFKFFFKKWGYFKELKSSCVDGRGLAASRLGEMGYPKAVPALIETLQDENPYVRSCAVRALGEIGDARAIEPLLEALKDTAPNVCYDAIEALERIAEKAEVDLVKMQSPLKRFVEQNNRHEAKRFAASLYAKMAHSVSEKKQAQLPKDMLPASFKPKKKPGMYKGMRRRATNG